MYVAEFYLAHSYLTYAPVEFRGLETIMVGRVLISAGAVQKYTVRRVSPTAVANRWNSFDPFTCYMLSRGEWVQFIFRSIPDGLYNAIARIHRLPVVTTVSKMVSAFDEDLLSRALSASAGSSLITKGLRQRLAFIRTQRDARPGDYAVIGDPVHCFSAALSGYTTISARDYNPTGTAEFIDYFDRLFAGEEMTETYQGLTRFTSTCGGVGLDLPISAPAACRGGCEPIGSLDRAVWMVDKLREIFLHNDTGKIISLRSATSVVMAVARFEARCCSTTTAYHVDRLDPMTVIEAVIRTSINPGVMICH